MYGWYTLVLRSLHRYDKYYGWVVVLRNALTVELNLNPLAVHQATGQPLTQHHDVVMSYRVLGGWLVGPTHPQPATICPVGICTPLKALLYILQRARAKYWIIANLEVSSLLSLLFQWEKWIEVPKA